jgi:hypothetical protein
VKDDGAAVTKAGGTNDIPEGGDVCNKRRRRAKVFHEAQRLFSEGAKRRRCCTECANDINRRGTISEKFLKEINKKRKGCIGDR